MLLSKQIKSCVLPSFLMGFIGCAAFAHHSTAAYDLKRDVVLEGVVQEYHWANPHSWILVQVADTNGKLTPWNVEFGTPSISIRVGWSPSTFKPGDKATFVVHPRYDGETHGVLSLAILPDGTQLRGMTQLAGSVPGIDNK